MNASSHDKGRAVLWMCAALVCFSLLAVASRELTREMSTLNILFWRSLLGFILVSVLLIHFAPGKICQQSLQVIRWHLLRNMTHFGGQCAWLLAIAAIPLAEVFALEFTTPLWAAVLAAVFLGEPLRRHRLVALSLGLLGVLIILRPGFETIDSASLVMLLGAFGFAISIVTTRRITLLQASEASVFLFILFFMTGMQTVFSLTLLAGEVAIPVRGQWYWLFTASFTALAAHYCLTRALSLADAAVVMPIDYLRLPLIMLVAWYLYDEPFSWSISLGALVILAANAAGLYGERHHKRV
jgi:drug/metabolite transporter (DMT)-like permease